jgi:hypothetical protein
VPDLDELIRGRLQARARPVDAGPALFDGIDRRRARRVVRRRVGSAAATVAFLVAVVGGFALVGRSGSPVADSNTPTPAPGVGNGVIVSVMAGTGRLSSLWTGPTQLTPDGTLAGETGFMDASPSVDPSGTLVAFTRQLISVNGAALYTVPLKGTPSGPCPTCGFVATRVLDSSWFVADPAWSPDGSKIAFAGGGKSRPIGIYTVGIIPPTPPKLAYAAPTDLSMVEHPSWSPDGSKLVFAEASAALGTPPDFDLYVVASNGTGGAIDITREGPDSQVQPAWSPDGKHIVFTIQNRVGGITVSSLAIISPDGTALRYLIGGQNASWAPDGTQIVFEGSTHPPAQDQPGILTMPASGGLQRFVRFGSDPSWQPIQGLNSVGILPPTAGIPGLSYPVCQVDVIRAMLIKLNPNAQTYLFTKPGSTGCRQTPGDPAFLATTVHGLGPFPSTVDSGPIACSPSCSLLAAPDLNHDGLQELAVIVTGSTSMFGVQLYRARPDGHFTGVRDNVGGNPLFFNWGRSSMVRAGVACSASGLLDFWTAFKRTGTWHVNHRISRLRNNTVETARVYDSTTRTESDLPAGGGSDFCGARVLPQPTPGP